MEHPRLNPREKKIVSEACGRIGAQLLREQVPEERWPDIVLAIVVELSGQVLRLVDEDERTDPHVTLPSEAPAP